MELPAVELDTFAHTDQSAARMGRGGPWTARPRIGDLNDESVVAVVDARASSVNGGVLDHIGQGLLDDPVGRQVGPGGQGAGLPANREIHPHTCLSGLLDELVQVGQPRGWGQ